MYCMAICLAYYFAKCHDTEQNTQHDIGTISEQYGNIYHRSWTYRKHYYP